MSIRAITFDLDDTLWETWPTILRAEQRLHEWLHHHHPAITARYDSTELRELRAEVQRRRPDIGYNLSLLRQEGLRLAAEQTGEHPFDAEAAFAVFHAARNDVLFFDDALPALERLAAHFPLGALSNGNADIHQVGIGHLFRFALSAADVRRPKPDPAMFELAQNTLGEADPAGLVHIGDDPHTDVLGARQAGWRCIWVNRSGELWSHQHRPDAEVRSLTELEPLLLKWAAAAPSES